MIYPNITIIVSPRERFSYTKESLESIYQNTKVPFSLVYIDGNSPSSVHQYLREQSQVRGFQLIRTEYYLSPNQARNLGLRYTHSKYVVFIDNDVHVAPGWLEQLVNCVEETEATIVSPLTCIGKPLHSKVHLAGGEARIIEEFKDDKLKRKLHEKHYFVNRGVADVKDQLQRKKCEFAEFHCMLVRTSIFDRIGWLDEALLSTREHIDFCLSVTLSGGTIYCEPESVVTYVAETLSKWSDISYFMLRWSDAWEIESLQHFRKKWNVAKKDKYFKKRYKRLGYRRHQAFVRPFIHKLTFGHSIPGLENLILSWERKFNQYITNRYTQQHSERMVPEVIEPPSVENTQSSVPASLL